MTIERTGLVTPALARLRDFWLGKCRGDMPPASGEIAPADLREWKDNIVVFEVLAEDSFVYSYYGKALAEAFGESRLGATLDALPPEQRAILGAEYAAAIRDRQPAARTHTALFNGASRSFERLVLPLCGEGPTVDKLLVAAYELPATDSERGAPPADAVPETAADDAKTDNANTEVTA